MPVRQTTEPFTWQSSAPYTHTGWTRTTYVVVLCALFAAGGYFLGRTVAAPRAKPLDRTAIEAVDRTAATAADVAARENTMATVGTHQSTSGETPSRPIARPSASPDRPSVVPLSPTVAVQEEPNDRGEGRMVEPAHKKESVITKKPNRSIDQDTHSARSDANRPRVVVPRPSLANDDFRPKPRRYRNDRDVRGFTLRGVAMKLQSNAP